MKTAHTAEQQKRAFKLVFEVTMAEGLTALAGAVGKAIDDAAAEFRKIASAEIVLVQVDALCEVVTERTVAAITASKRRLRAMLAPPSELADTDRCSPKDAA